MLCCAPPHRFVVGWRMQLHSSHPWASNQQWLCDMISCSSNPSTTAVRCFSRPLAWRQRQGGQQRGQLPVLQAPQQQPAPQPRGPRQPFQPPAARPPARPAGLAAAALLPRAAAPPLGHLQ
jgi:hypothetical protein